MSFRSLVWKQFALSLLFMLALTSCKKQKPKDNPELPVATSDFEEFSTTNHISYCNSEFISDLKIKDGTNIGTVTVANDATHLFLTYNLSGDWYFTSIQSYAGKKTQMPVTAQGNPNNNKFPGKKNISSCDLKQNFTFRVPLTSLQSDDNQQCFTSAQFFIAMRASVREITNVADCSQGNDQDAWAAPVLINPGNADEWATAFYYCKQDCTPWCSHGQGYWFAKPNLIWCQPSVSFGILTITQDEGRALWPAQNNAVKKVFFKASALQLSMMCKNSGHPIPPSISNDYDLLVTFLSGLSYSDIENGIVPPGTDMDAIKTALENIGKWICENNCDLSEDPTACTE